MVDRFKEPHDLPSLHIKKSKQTANYNNKSKEKKGTAVAVKLYLLFQSHEDENKYQSINQSLSQTGFVLHVTGALRKKLTFQV